MMHHLPDRQPPIGARVPVGRQLVRLQQPDLAASGLHNARLDQAVHGSDLRAGQHVGHAELAFGEARCSNHASRPAGIGVEVALLLGQRQVERLVDQRQRSRTLSDLPSASSTLA